MWFALVLERSRKYRRTIVQSPANPLTLNRYSYCLNNPLKYVDPSGHIPLLSVDDDPGATSEEVQDFWERAGETLEDHPEEWSTISSLDPINDIDTANSGLQAIEQSIGDDEIIGPTLPELPLLSSSSNLRSAPQTKSSGDNEGI